MNAAGVCQMLDELAGISDVPGEITRLYLSPAHRRAVKLVEGWMRQAGMTTRLDAMATLIGRYEGEKPGLPSLVIGSHIDSVRNAGRFDGPLGVMLGVALVAKLQAAGRRLPFTLDIVAFGDEEGVRFPSTITGSRAMAGVFEPSVLEERDQDGVRRRDALIAFGCDPDLWPACRLRPDTIGYIEAHIEQGPVLEARGLALGTVTAIAGASRGAVCITGAAAHAGTMPMEMRKDALAAAAEMVLAVERIGQSHPDLRATVGQLDIPSSAINTVPGRVRFTIDVRSPDDTRRTEAVRAIAGQVQHIAAARGVKAEITMGYVASAAPCDEQLMRLLDEAVSECGQTPFRLQSGAGHDAMAFRGVLPMVMLFVRCRAGISHNPAEFASNSDIALALAALEALVEKLASQG
ncbi:MAG: allantoate amidohydrolase [Bosea sp. (in: a-proteobacteria)]